MPESPVATVLPPAEPRTPLIIRFDLQEAGGNIEDLADQLQIDAGNAGYVIRRIEAEIEWLRDLLCELRAAVR